MSDRFHAGFAVREPSWHRKETLLDRPPATLDECRIEGDHAWEPLLAPTFGFVGLDKDGKTTLDPAQAIVGEYVSDEAARRVVRSDDFAFLSNVNDSYALITNTQAYDVIGAMVGREGLQFETGMTLDGGKVCFVLIKIDRPLDIPGDPSETHAYVIATWRHDGRGALRLGRTNIRVVCWNTLSWAESQAEREGHWLTINHYGNVEQRIEQVKAAITETNREADEWAELANRLYSLPVTDQQVRVFVDRFIALPPAGTYTDRVRRNNEEAQQALLAFLHGPSCEGIERTALGLVNASTEFLDHGRRIKNTETYVRRQVIEPQPGKAKAVRLALAVAQA